MWSHEAVTNPQNEVFLLKSNVADRPLESQTCKLYKMRWCILLMSFVLSVSNLMHFLQYAIIADVVVHFYGVTYTAVHWSTTIFLLVCMIFGFPASFVSEKWGLRVAVLLGMGLTCVGSWVKVASVSPDRYWVVLLGQGIIAIAQVLILPLPSKIAAVWFGPKEISLACSIGVSGVQTGLAVGFFVSPSLLGGAESQDDITNGLYIMSLCVSVVCTAIFCVITIFYKAMPPTPPSIAQLKVDKKEHFFKSVKMFMYSRTNFSLSIAFGIAIGMLLAVSTLLNEIVLEHYPNAHKSTGWIGLTTIVAGIVGSIVSGVVLDKFQKFKQTVLILSALAIASMLGYTFAISKGIEFVYLISVIFGWSSLGMHVTGIQLGAELSYPIPEGISAGILITSVQVFGIAFTYIYSHLFNTYGDFYANLTMFVVLLIEFVLLCTLKYDLRRHAAENVNRT